MLKKPEADTGHRQDAKGKVMFAPKKPALT